MIDPKLQVAELLAKGANPQLIATTMGLDVSTVLDMMADPMVRMRMQTAAANRLDQALDMDNLATQIEALTLNQLFDALGRERDPKKLAAIYQIMNKSAKRVAKPEDEGLNPSDAVVSLILPAGYVHRKREKVVYEVDAAGNVVTVDGKSLQTMSSQKVLELAKEKSSQIKLMSESKGDHSVVRMEDL